MDKKSYFWGLSLQLCLFVCSQCFYPLEAVLSRAIGPGIYTHIDLFPAPEPTISNLQTKTCVPPLLPPHVPENHEHPPASSPIHHILTQSYGLRNCLPAVWLTKYKPHQTQPALLHQRGPCSAARVEKLLFYLSGSWRDWIQWGIWGGEEKTPPGQGNQSLAIHFTSYIS